MEWSPDERTDISWPFHALFPRLLPQEMHRMPLYPPSAARSSGAYALSQHDE